MSTSKTIQTAIKNAYASITLPNSLGAPTGYLVEPDEGFASLPAVVIYRGRTLSITRQSGGAYRIQREFVARLFTAKYASDSPSHTQTMLENAADCVEVIEDYFMLDDNRLGGTRAVTESVITQDTADTTLYDRANDTYAGVMFRHLVTYVRTSSTP